MTSASAHCPAIRTLHEIGIAFQHGHVVRPLGCLAQVLWFRLESRLMHHGRIPSITGYWIEEAGELLRVRRCGIVLAATHPFVLLENPMFSR